MNKKSISTLEKIKKIMRVQNYSESTINRKLMKRMNIILIIVYLIVFLIKIQNYNNPFTYLWLINVIVFILIYYYNAKNRKYEK